MPGAEAPGNGRGRRKAIRRIGWGSAALAVGSLAGCGRSRTDPEGPLDFWAMGREAEVVVELLAAFRERHPTVQVRVQQLPWSAAHEKLLTAFAGDALPDLCQLGNTWLPEFSALGALEPLDERMAGRRASRATTTSPASSTPMSCRGPMVRAGFSACRGTSTRACCSIAATCCAPPGMRGRRRHGTSGARRCRTSGGSGAAAPMARCCRSTSRIRCSRCRCSRDRCSRDGDGRGAFSQPPFRRALDFYVGLFRDDLAPRMTATQVANVWDEFARGLFAFYVTGPWNIGEFRRRLPAERQGDWATAPLPGPDGPGVSTAGGSSLVIFKGSRRKEAAWKLISFLSEPETMLRFHALTGDLPPRRSAWRAPALANDPPSQAFAQQLERVRAAPKIPEWERIFQEMQLTAERVVQGRQGAEAACRQLDAWVDALLEKRRWLRSGRA